MKIGLLFEDSQRNCNKIQKLENLPVAKDIARLARKVRLTLNKNELKLDINSESSQLEVLFQLLSVLGKELQNVDIKKEEVEKEININDHYTLTKVKIQKD